MIQTDEQLRRTREAPAAVGAMLAALNRTKSEMHPSWFTLMAEPVLDQLHRLRGQIDHDIGLRTPRRR